VLNVSTNDGSTLIKWDSRATFLDEFRLLVTSYANATCAPELVVFDTLTPQDHPGGFQRFGLPLRYWHHNHRIHADCDRPLGKTTRGGPLVVDPTQAVVVMVLTQRIDPGPHVLLTVRTNILIQRACSVHTLPCIPWEEWGEDSVATEIPLNRTEFSTFVLGTHVLVVVRLSRVVPNYCLYTFDFSRRGCRALPLWGGEGGGIERWSVFEDARKLVFEGDQGMSPGDMVLMDNGIMVHLRQVSYISRSVGDNVVG